MSFGTSTSISPKEKRKSRNGLKVLAVALTVLLVTAALFGYSYTQITTNVSGVEFTAVTFREPNAATLVSLIGGNYAGAVLSLIDSLVLQVDLEVGNGGILPVSIPTVEFDYSINGISMGSGRSDSSYTISPRQLQTIPIKVDVPAARIQSVVTSIVSSVGEVDVEVKGTLKASLLGLPINIPFETTKHISLRQMAEDKAKAWLSRMGGGQGDIPTDFQIVSYKWTVNGRDVTTSTANSRVTGIMLIRAEQRFGYTLTLEARQDRALLSDVSASSESYPLVMQPGETKELSVDFVAESGITVRGYFLSLRWSGKQWQMPADYPPRLAMAQSAAQPPAGSITVEDAYWSVGASRVTSVASPTQVTVNLVVRASGAYTGAVTVEIRKDIIGLPDTSVTSRQYNVALSSGQTQTLTLLFTAQKETGSRGYFVQVTWSSGAWTMPDSYPPRLTVTSAPAAPPPAPSQGVLRVISTDWTINGASVTSAPDKSVVTARLLVRSEGGFFTGNVQMEIRQDKAGLPDDTLSSNTFVLSMSSGEVKELTITFTVKDSFTLRGYFMRASWQTDSWEMSDNYPPRLSVK